MPVGIAAFAPVIGTHTQLEGYAVGDGGGDAPVHPLRAAVPPAAALLHRRHQRRQHQGVTRRHADRSVHRRRVRSPAGRRASASPPSIPSTEEPIGEVARGDADDVDRAVARRRRARCAATGARSRRPRAAACSCASPSAIAAAQGGAGARWRPLDVGKPLKESRGDVDGVVATLIYNAGAADKMEGATIPLGPDVVDFTLHGADRRHRPYRALELSARHGDPLARRRRSPPAARPC